MLTFRIVSKLGQLLPRLPLPATAFTYTSASVMPSIRHRFSLKIRVSIHSLAREASSECPHIGFRGLTNIEILHKLY